MQYFQDLVPYVTGITLSAVAVICTRSHYQDSDSEYTFTASPLLRYALAAGVVYFCFAPLVPGSGGDIPRIKFFFMCSPYWAGAFLVLIYYCRYRVIVTDTTLTVGAFTFRQFSFDEVTDYDVILGGKSGKAKSALLIYLRAGTKLRLDNWFGDWQFDDLIGLINSHMCIPPRGAPDSPAKLRDRAARVRNHRVKNVLMYILLAVIACLMIRVFAG